jgi:hypothetical protein
MTTPTGMVDLDNLRQEGWPDAADELERLRKMLSWIEDHAPHLSNVVNELFPEEK